MSRTRRRLGAATLAVTAALVAAQAVATTSVANAASPDGASGPSKAIKASQTPYQVRDHSAKLTGRLAASQHLRLAIGLKTRDQAGQEAFNAAVQDRKSPQFHHYLTAAQWNARFGPTAADEAAVVKWAKDSGLTVSQRWSNRLLVDIDSPASSIEKAFGVHLNKYSLGGKTFFSNDADPTLPASVKSLVSSVDGLNNLQAMQSAGTSTAKMPLYSAGPTAKNHASLQHNGSMKALKAALAARKAHPKVTGGYYDPTDLYSSQAYDVNAEQSVSPCCNPAHVSSGSPAQTSIAVVTAGKHAFSTDIPGFYGRYSYLAARLFEQYIDGTPTTNDFEGTMDAEWALAMGNSFGSYLDTSTITVYSGVNANFSTFDDMYNKVLSDNTSKIVTSSWGCAEYYCTPDGTMNTDHSIFNAMTAQGFTMVNSSNDKGPYADCAHVSVHYPASDPNWLAIGGTTLQAAGSFQSETAWTGGSAAGSCANNNGGGGGGCSAKWAAPSWQSGISSQCGSSSRALPDVSLNASIGQNTYYLGGWYGGAGTSISAPMFGGLFARENSYLLSLGSKCGLGTGTAPCAPIGMPGTEVYDAGVSHSAGRNPYYDVTSGCTSNDIGGGWCAGSGWDKATGWGSVNMLQFAYAINYWTVAEASAPTVAMSGGATSGWTNTPISYSVSDNGGSFAASGIAGVTAQWDTAPDNTLTHATPGSGDSFYSGPASTTTLSNTLSLTGCHTLYVRAWDNIGLSTLNSYAECFDNVAPTVTGATFDINNKTTIQNNGAANIHIQWSGSDATSGIASYDLWRSTDGGTYDHLLTGITRTHDDETLDPGHTYTFAISAYDAAGNFSGFSYTPVTVNTYDQDDSSVTYTTNGWTRLAVANSYLGKVKYSTVLNKRASFAFNGFDVAFVTTKGAAYGNVSFKLDGGTAFIANTNASSTSTRQIVYKSGAVSSGSHTLEVRNQGSAGHSRVDIDAFVVLS